MSGALLLLGGAVVAGAATQRVTGVGFALVSAPFLVLLTGPVQGVLLANLLSLVLNLGLLSMLWRAVELRRTLLLAAPALAVLPLGAWVARQLRPAVLSVLIGTLIGVALLVVLTSPRVRLFSGTLGALAAGALSGFMNVTAGVGGPAMAVYATSTGWAQAGFAASMQLLFALVNTGSVLTKGLPRLSEPQAWTIAGALLAGVLLGQLLTRWITAQQARTGVVVLALTGACATVVEGATSW